MLPHSLTHFVGLAMLLVISTIIVANNVAAQTTTTTTTSLANNPGCYARCRYIQLDYDPTRMNELCDKERSLGSLFLDNIKSCAECVEEEGELSEYFDRADAQDALNIVNLCQSLFGTDHEEMVSAMSVISSIGGVVGTIASPSVTANSTTNVPTTTSTTTITTTTTTTDSSSPTPNPATDPSAPSEESSAWIAGPVVGSVAGVAVIIAAALLLLRRRRKRRQATAGLDNGEDKDPSRGGADDHYLYGKPELPGDGHSRHELDGHSAAVETIARPPLQELDAGEVVGAELPTNNVK